jgi:hypothetical protein
MRPQLHFPCSEESTLAFGDKFLKAAEVKFNHLQMGVTALSSHASHKELKR